MQSAGNDVFYGVWLHFKSRGLCLVQLCAKYKLVSATLSLEKKLLLTR